MAGGQAAFEQAKTFYDMSIEGLKALRWNDIPEPVRRYIEEHPKLTAVQLVMLLMLTCPALVAAPALGVMGFSGIGPVAGSFAAWYQSTFGATWIFPWLQSAAMSGYAAGTVNGIVQGAAAVGGGIAHLLKRG